MNNSGYQLNSFCCLRRTAAKQRNTRTQIGSTLHLKFVLNIIQPRL